MATVTQEATARKRDIDSSRALLLDPQQSAAFLGVSLRKYYELRASGQLPPPVRLGERIVRHRRADLEEFVENLEADTVIPEPAQLATGKAKKRRAERKHGHALS